MKKTLIFAVVIISLLAVSCKSTPQEVTEEAFAVIYERHIEGLILDGAEQYTVRSGDTLVSIARDKYKNGFYYPVIMLASKDVIKDPDKIQPGMVLTIPNLDVNLNSPGAVSSIKGVIRDCAALEDTRSRRDTAKGLRDLANSL